MPRWDEQVTMPSDLSPVAEGEVVTYHLPLDEVHRRYGKPGERRSIVRTESEKVLQLLESGKTPAQVRQETGYSLQQIGGIVTSRGRKYSDLPFWPRLVESIRADKESTNALVQEFGVSWPTMQKLIAAEGEKRTEQAQERDIKVKQEPEQPVKVDVAAVDREAIKTGVKQGMSPMEIAKRWEMNVDDVLVWAFDNMSVAWSPLTCMWAPNANPAVPQGDKTPEQPASSGVRNEPEQGEQHEHQDSLFTEPGDYIEVHWSLFGTSGTGRINKTEEHHDQISITAIGSRPENNMELTATLRGDMLAQTLAIIGRVGALLQ